MSDRPSVSWVIVAFHRPGPLDGLLRAVENESDIEVIVVNVEADTSVDRVAMGRAVTVAPAENIGYAAAVNLGANYATADVVVFSNDDLVVEADAIRTLADAVRGSDVEVAIPSMTTLSGERELTINALPTPMRLLWEWAVLPDKPNRFVSGLCDVQKWRAPTVRERIEGGCAAIVAVKRTLLARRPLPEQYFLYWEEHDWFWQLRADGVHVVYAADVIVQHDGGRSDVRPEKARLLARNAVRCVRSTQGRMAAAGALVSVVLWQMRLVFVDAVRVVTRRAGRERFTTCVAGLSAAAAAWREVVA